MCSTGLVPHKGGGGARRPRGRALCIGVVQNIDVVIAFFVFAHGKFCAHPIALAFAV